MEALRAYRFQQQPELGVHVVSRELQNPGSETWTIEVFSVNDVPVYDLEIEIDPPLTFGDAEYSRKYVAPFMDKRYPYQIDYPPSLFEVPFTVLLKYKDTNRAEFEKEFVLNESNMPTGKIYQSKSEVGKRLTEIQKELRSLNKILTELLNQ